MEEVGGAESLFRLTVEDLAEFKMVMICCLTLARGSSLAKSKGLKLLKHIRASRLQLPRVASS